MKRLAALYYPIDGNARGLFFRVLEQRGIRAEYRDSYLAGVQLDDFVAARVFARMHGFSVIPASRTVSGFESVGWVGCG